MKNYLTFKPFYTSLKFLLLLSLFFGISNCKRDIYGPCDEPDKTFDTSFFEKNEKDLIPDWEGDSLFFYSDAGDTAYLFCKSQGFGYGKDESVTKTYDCDYTHTYPKEGFGATYRSNNPELNNLQIEIYKESYLRQETPPFRQAVIDISAGISAIGWYSLLDFDGKTLPNDSVLLANGKYESGWVKDSKTLRPIMNLKVGLIVIERKNVKKWTLFRYTLNN